MRFNVIGWNYIKTPLEIRDKLFLSTSEQLIIAKKLKLQFKLGGIVVLSTCNRTEFYLVNADEKLDQIIRMLENYWSLPELVKSVYILQNEDGVRHLFRVASSLESMVLGEPQILGQLKESFQNFHDSKLAGKLLHPLFSRAFSTAKRVRSETTIASNAVSVSYAAVELAKQIFEDLSKQRVMIIGAGEMAELSIRHLIKNGISQLIVVNRTFSNAAKLAEKFQGIALPFERIHSHLHESDIVISSTGASSYIINHTQVKESLRKRKGNPVFFIDIAVPRDIDPDINNLQGAFCYDIDDLQSIVSKNKKGREKESVRAEEIIENELEELKLWFKTLSVVPTIRSLRRAFHSVAEEEMVKAFRKLKDLQESEKKEVEILVHRLVHKILHGPSKNLKQIANAEDANFYLESISKIFGLSPPPVNLEKVKNNKTRLKVI